MERQIERRCGLGIKLASVATDILGVSRRAMLEALVQGMTDPVVLADLARGRLRKKAAGTGRGPGRAVSPARRVSGRATVGALGVPRRGDHRG